MKKVICTVRALAFITLCLFTVEWTAAQQGTMKGTVKDKNGAALAGASIIVEGTKKGTITDSWGNYSLTLTAGKYNIGVSYAGLTALHRPVTIENGSTITLDFTSPEAANLNSVVVVGSRNHDARSFINTPVPVDVIREKEVKVFGQQDLSQMLTYVTPSFQSARQTISDGTDHVDPAGLRGLGPDQTLVLLNGKRRHTSALVNINGTVGRGSVGTDLNAIPAAAVERIEVLRDGASAQYGSDAIAGVINVVLKKNYNGFNVSAMVGEDITNMPYKGGIKIQDGLNQQVDFSGGFAKKNGTYFNISGQWLKRFSTNRSGDDNIPLIYLGNAGAFPTNPYANVSTADYRKWLMDQDAAIVQQRGYNRHNNVAGNSYSQNFGAFINAGTKVLQNVDFYLTAGASHRDGEATGNSRNPNSVSQQPVLADGQRFYADGFLPQIAPTIEDWSLLTGFSIKAGSWDIDISNTAGKNSLHYQVNNSGNSSLPATDNVQTSFDAGKIAFFQNTINLDISRKYYLGAQSSLNFAFGGELRHEDFQITAGETNSWTNGKRVASIDSIPPYPGTITGTKFGTVSPASGAQVFPGFKPEDAIKASRNVSAAYTDLEWKFGKVLLDGAARYENYSEKGFSYDNLSGKLAGRYEVSKNISIRGAISSGFRAPSLQQRYFQNTSTQFVNAQPSTSLTANNYNPVVRNAFGINELKPEKSTSYSLGVAGKLARGLTVTVDGYFISIKDRIVLSTPFNRSNPLVDTILKAYKVDSSISALQFWTNAVNTETKGIDIVITEKFALGHGNATIMLAANFNRNDVVGPIHTNSRLDSARYNPFKGDPGHGIPGNPAANPANDLSFTLFDRQQRGRIETAQPKSKINLTLGYTIKNWDFLLRNVRFGEVQSLNNVDPASKRLTDGFYFNDVGFGADQVFSAKIITDLVVSYRFKMGLTLTAGSNNILDIYPDKVFIDPRNDLGTVHNDPTGPSSFPAAAKSTTGYNSGRDLSNRGRFLFFPNQFGFNGRFVYTRVSFQIGK